MPLWEQSPGNGLKSLRMRVVLFIVCLLVSVLDCPGQSYYRAFRPPPPATGGTPVDVCKQITLGVEDAEEDQPFPGSVSNSSSDLELGNDNGQPQTVGIYFSGLNIPAGATINSAKVQFGVDNTSINDPLAVRIYCQEGAAPANFSAGGTGNLSSRDWTESFVTWTLTGGSWSPVGNAGPDQLSADFASVLQEVVDNPSYVSTHAIVVFFEETGDGGERECESADGDAPFPELCVNYTP